MPIKGLSERLRLPRRGKIRLGEKKISKKTGKEYPSALDYFVVPGEVKKVYGEKPRKLDIMIPMENRDAFFPQNYKMYGKSKGLICRGDGETAMRVDPQSPELTEIECAGKNCEYFKDGKEIEGHMYRCNTIGNLQVILPKIKGLGIYQIDTSSYNSIVNINSCLEMIRGMMGRISWIPLILEVNMQEAHPTVKGKKITTTIPVMTITADVTPEELLAKSMLTTQETQKLPELTDEQIKGIKEVAEIDNPDRDDKPELLYTETEEPPEEKEIDNEIEQIKSADQEKEAKQKEEKKAGQKETSLEEEKKAHKKQLEAEKEQEMKTGDEEIPEEIELRQEIEGLFDKLNWPVGRRIIWQKKEEYDNCETTEGMTKLRDDLKKKIKDEEQGNLFHKGEA
ncbi:hypothetical protein KKA53_05140 [Candidatus Dependentiae bacterium]|nr:hypothetical protein [Candidatus Dependentiae bacterium]